MYRTLGHREEILRGVLSADLRRGTLTTAAGGEGRGHGIRMAIGWLASGWLPLTYATRASRAPPSPAPTLADPGRPLRSLHPGCAVASASAH